MTLLRAAARTMLASYFVASGVKALRDPDSLVPARRTADRPGGASGQGVRPAAGRQLHSGRRQDAGPGATEPPSWSAGWPWPAARAAGWARCCWPCRWCRARSPSTRSGAVATRPSGPHDQHQFLKNVSLLGGVLLASRDTEGKPSLAWRAQKGGQAMAKSTSKASDKLTKRAEALTDGGSDLAESALATGAALVGTVVATSQEGPQGGHQAVRPGAGGGGPAGRGGAQGGGQGRQAGQEGRPQAAQGRQEGCRRAGRGGQEAGGRGRARAPRPRPRRRRKRAAKKLAKNIDLGENEPGSVALDDRPRARGQELPRGRELTR